MRLGRIWPCDPIRECGDRCCIERGIDGLGRLGSRRLRGGGRV